jgi:hypothetical protein
MKVYLVYAYTEDENGIIDKIFDTKRKALDYVIKQYYSDPFHKKMNPDWLDNNASKFVAEKELE